MLPKTIADVVSLAGVSVQPLQQEYESHLLKLQQLNILNPDLLYKDLPSTTETRQLLGDHEGAS